MINNDALLKFLEGDLQNGSLEMLQAAANGDKATLEAMLAGLPEDHEAVQWWKNSLSALRPGSPLAEFVSDVLGSQTVVLDEPVPGSNVVPFPPHPAPSKWIPLGQLSTRSPRVSSGVGFQAGQIAAQSDPSSSTQGHGRAVYKDENQQLYAWEESPEQFQFMFEILGREWDRHVTKLRIQSEPDQNIQEWWLAVGWDESGKCIGAIQCRVPDNSSLDFQPELVRPEHLTRSDLEPVRNSVRSSNPKTRRIWGQIAGDANLNLDDEIRQAIREEVDREEE